jgi:hypothetical protein
MKCQRAIGTAGQPERRAHLLLIRSAGEVMDA